MAGPALQYFTSLKELFLQRQAAVGSRQKTVSIAGLVIKIVVAGPVLPEIIFPAVQSIESAEKEAAYTILVYDGFAPRLKIPPFPHWDDAYHVSQTSIVSGYTDERFVLSLFKFKYSNLFMFDRVGKEALCIFPEPHSIPGHELGSPLRSIINWMLLEQGKCLLHAAAVGLPAGGVIISGKGGSGKSTTALACLDSPLSYIGDDYCCIDERDGGYYARQLYSSAKISFKQADKLPVLKPMLSSAICSDNEKYIFFIDKHFPKKLLKTMPLRAVFVPEITGLQETSIRETSKAAAFMALAPSSVFQLSGHNSKKYLHIIAALVKRLPCYRLALGSDLSQIPQTIIDFLTEKQKSS